MKNHIIANAGRFYICYRLSCLDFTVLPVHDGNKQIVFCQKDRLRLQIQTRACTGKSNFMLGENDGDGDYLIAVTNILTEPETFILSGEEVKKLTFNKKHLAVAIYDVPEFREAWHKLLKLKSPVPIASL